MVRLEFLASALGFGAGSLFLIVAALLLDAARYGELMQLQSLLLVCVAAFSFRTYDLVFFLQKHLSRSVRTSFLLVVVIELGLAIACVLSISLMLLLDVGVWFGFQSGLSTLGAVLAGVLCSATIFQGASQALLRVLHLDRKIAWADILSGAAFLAASAALAINGATTVVFVLACWLLAMLVRPAALLTVAIVHAKDIPADEGDNKVETEIGRREIAKFLIAGQFTNLLKNNSVAIETLLLGRLAGSEAVALFRVARSFLNLPTVFLNIAYQKSFRELTNLGSSESRITVLHRIDRQAIQIWLASLPITFGAAYLFANISNDVVYSQLMMVLSLVALATFPNVLQQSIFAALSLDGRFSRINISYAVGLFVLIGGCLATYRWFSIEVFAGWLLLCGFVRYASMRALTKGS